MYKLSYKPNNMKYKLLVPFLQFNVSINPTKLNGGNETWKQAKANKTLTLLR